MAEKATPKGLYAKIAAVMGEVSSIPKKGENTFHKYSYARESDVMDMVRPVLSKHGLVIIPSRDPDRPVEMETRESQRGEKTYMARVPMVFKIIDSETGESVTSYWDGTGEDRGEKWLYKAYAGGEKYFLLKTFLLSTGDDDPENDNGNGNSSKSGHGKVQHLERPEPSKGAESGGDRPMTDKQRNKIYAIIKDLGLPKEKIEDRIKTQAGKESINDLTVREATAAIQGLEDLRAQKGKQPAKKTEAETVFGPFDDFPEDISELEEGKK
jgi:hypothetical protein